MAAKAFTAAEITLCDDYLNDKCHDRRKRGKNHTCTYFDLHSKPWKQRNDQVIHRENGDQGDYEKEQFKELW